MSEPKDTVHLCLQIKKLNELNCKSNEKRYKSIKFKDIKDKRRMINEKVGHKEVKKASWVSNFSSAV